MFRAGGRARLDVALQAKTFISKSGLAHAALGEVGFTLGDGEVAAIVGPSGCGKSTLMRIVTGLDRNYRGSIGLAPALRLGVAFQEPRLLPWMSAEDNVRLVAPGIAESELSDLFERLEIAEHRRHLPGELSLGLARRVALARALAVRPDLLLLDEPFASLDAATRGSLVEELSAIIEARGLTTLMITHDIDAAVRLADVIYALSPRPGRLVGRIDIATPRERLTVAEARRATEEIASFA